MNCTLSVGELLVTKGIKKKRKKENLLWEPRVPKYYISSRPHLAALGSKQRDGGFLTKTPSNANLFRVEQKEEDYQGKVVGVPGCHLLWIGSALISPPISFQVFSTDRWSELATMREARSVVSPVYLKEKKIPFISYLGKHWIELLSRAIVTTLGEKELHLFFHLFFIQMPTVLIINAGPSCGVRGTCEEREWWNESPEFIRYTFGRRGYFVSILKKWMAYFALFWALSTLWSYVNIRGLMLVSYSLMSQSYPLPRSTNTILGGKNTRRKCTNTKIVMYFFT